MLRSIDQSLCPMEHMLWIILCLLGFLCITDIGRRGNKITALRGIPNTATPLEKLANTEILCQKSTKYLYHIWSVCLLKVVSILRVKIYLKHVCTRNQPQPLQENVGRPQICWCSWSLDVPAIPLQMKYQKLCYHLPLCLKILKY